MGLINAAGLADDDPVGVPLIGYENFVTALNITSSTEDASFPVTNLANPATHLKWVGGVTTGDEVITITGGSTDDVDYVGIAGHNFGTIGALVSLETTDSPPVELISPYVPSDDVPIVFRFAPQVLAGISIRIVVAGLVAPEAAVVYFGKLLVMERSITLGRGHVPVTYGRRTTVVNGMSESGNFLGRIVLGEYRQSKAEFEWITPTFYRSDVDAFLAAAQEVPFFWVWWPDTYPGEVGYVWLTNNAEPETDPATRRVSLTLEMRGVA